MPQTWFPPLVQSNGSHAPDWFVSFDIAKYLLFWGLTCGIGYPLYRIVGVLYLKWEGHPKSPSKNFNDMIESITYTLPLFIFGNYSNTLNWIMMITYFFSLFFFGWIAEAPFLRHSLVTIKCWPKGMYITVVTVVVTIIAALSYHIYLAYSFQFYLEDGITTACILGWYLVGISIPVSLLISGWGVCLSQNASSDVFVRWMRRTTPQSSDYETGTAAAAAAAAGTSSGCDQWEKVCLHPHHWAIFYSIAYFTRFDNIASNIAAGLCLGSYVHGIAAYGHDHLLER